jgi:hypothetical protein
MCICSNSQIIILYCLILHDISLLSLFSKIKSKLRRSPRCISVNPLIPSQTTSECLNQSSWCVYHATWAHLNGILRKSLPSVCVSPYCFQAMALQNVAMATNTHAAIEETLDKQVISYSQNFLIWLIYRHKYNALYRVIQEKLISDILSKKCHINLSYTRYLQSYVCIWKHTPVNCAWPLLT